MSESDRELLELAAKAYSSPDVQLNHVGFIRRTGRNEAMGCDTFCVWNPLKDDGDALRLAVKLGLEIGICIDMPLGDYSFVRTDRIKAVMENHQNEPGAATRRAIVRAAAEIGKS